MIKKLVFVVSILIFLPTSVLAQIDDLNGLIPDNNSSDDSLQHEESISLKSIELLWSADAYTPYNYQGRTLPTKGSPVTVNADLKISSGNLNNLKYSWFLDDVFQENGSGYGRNVFKFRARKSEGLLHKVLVKIFNDDRSFYVEKALEIPITKPELIIYSSNGNSHFSNQASITSTVLMGRTFSFVAKPYFFNINKLTDLVFEWTISGASPIISSDYDASIFNLTLSNKNTNGSTESNLWVSVKNSLDKNQKANGSMKINIY